MDKGRITAYDIRDCVCCGGWFIEINGITYRFYNIPDKSKLDIWNETLPIYVEIVWEKDENGCLGDEIIVEYINEIEWEHPAKSNSFRHRDRLHNP